MANLRSKSCVGFVSLGNADSVNRLKRFCWEQQWQWIGLAAGKTLAESLLWYDGKPMFRLITGEVVSAEIVAVRRYGDVAMESEVWRPTITKLSRANVPVVSATDVLEKEEIELLRMPLTMSLKIAA